MFEFTKIIKNFNVLFVNSNILPRLIRPKELIMFMLRTHFPLLRTFLGPKNIYQNICAYIFSCSISLGAPNNFVSEQLFSFLQYSSYFLGTH